MHWVENELQPHEDFLGLYKVDNIESNTMRDIPYSHICVIYMSHLCMLGLALRNVRNILFYK